MNDEEIRQAYANLKSSAFRLFKMRDVDPRIIGMLLSDGVMDKYNNFLQGVDDE